MRTAGHTDVGNTVEVKNSCESYTSFVPSRDGGFENVSISSCMNRHDYARLRHPLTDHLKDLPVTFIGVVESRRVDKDELVAVGGMIKNPVRGDFVGDGFQTFTRSHVLSSEGVDDLL